MSYSFALTHPTATIANTIESIVIEGENSENFIYQSGCKVLSRAISLTVFPIFLLLELTFKRVPNLLLSITDAEKFDKRADKVVKYILGFLFSPLGLHSPEGVSGLFLKSPPSSSIRPFGVELEYGKAVDRIFYPRNEVELQNIIQQAKKSKKQVSIIGAGMSQGTQTTPKDPHQVVINTKYLDKIEIAKDGKSVKVQSGANWEQLQILLNKNGKSSIVKQASDPFSIGGSIGINCHGWAHEHGAISSTVKELEIIDANGNLRTITPKDELFGCMFGTLGYFGVIVSATLDIVDNECLIEKTEEVEIDDFVPFYENNIKGKDIPLFGGRLVVDSFEGNPLRKAYMVYYQKDKKANDSLLLRKERDFTAEPKYGKRIERIALRLIAHLSNFSVKRLLNWLWSREVGMMFEGRRLTRNEALHPPINAFKMLHHSNLHTQWLQEYFIKKENLPDFLRFLGNELQENDVRLINATIRPTPKDNISILPYAEQDRYAVVICFSQLKTKKAIAHTKKWIDKVNDRLIKSGDVYYHAYMPYVTREQFEECYGKDTVQKLRRLKERYDPSGVFGNEYTAKYFDIRRN